MYECCTHCRPEDNEHGGWSATSHGKECGFGCNDDEREARRLDRKIAELNRDFTKRPSGRTVEKIEALKARRAALDA